MSSPSPQPAPPLDLAQFETCPYTLCEHCGRETSYPSAAPSLLAECQRQRHLLDAFAAGVHDMLAAWDNPTSASVKMRASAIAGLRGIMEHHQPTKEIK